MTNTEKAAHYAGIASQLLDNRPRALDKKLATRDQSNTNQATIAGAHATLALYYQRETDQASSRRD